MEQITLCQKQPFQYTLVQNNFLDHYMINANGEYVKIYLYLLRCLGDEQLRNACSISRFADIFDCTEKDILRALKYWEHAGLLTLQTDAGRLCRIELCEPEPLKASAAIETAGLSNKSDGLPKPAGLSGKSGGFSKASENPEARQLLRIAQTYLGKTLSPMEADKILYFYQDLGFSADLTEYLLEYCISNNHRSIRYIETVGLSWHEAGITSRKEAKEHVLQFSGIYSDVFKAFGLSGRAPTAIEREMIDRWQKDYGFDRDLILQACNRTISAIHQPSFQYADSILSKWKKAQVKNRTDLNELDSMHRKRKEQNAAAKADQPARPPKKNDFTNFPQREYNFDEIEKELLKRK